MERKHHPPVEQQGSLVDRIDIDDEDSDGVSMCERGKEESYPSVPALLLSLTALLLFFFFF